mgnify:CR=1 FL=1
MHLAGRDHSPDDEEYMEFISTHTPLARRDWRRGCRCCEYGDFYSHASCEARRIAPPFLAVLGHFYSHAPCGARPAGERRAEESTRHFYSHAPCGARPSIGSTNASRIGFLLTRPMRGATVTEIYINYIAFISTHMPHAGRDV